MQVADDRPHPGIENPLKVAVGQQAHPQAPAGFTLQIAVVGGEGQILASHGLAVAAQAGGNPPAQPLS